MSIDRAFLHVSEGGLEARNIKNASLPSLFKGHVVFLNKGYRIQYVCNGMFITSLGFLSGKKSRLSEWQCGTISGNWLFIFPKNWLPEQNLRCFEVALYSVQCMSLRNRISNLLLTLFSLSKL